LITTLTSLQVANRAITEIARGKPLASGTVATNFDGTPDGIYAATLYVGAVQLLLRQQDWEFSKRDVALALSGNAAPQPWTYEYIYPVDCLRVRQVRPSAWVQNDPQPVRWEVGDAVVSGNPATVIWTNQITAYLVYTTNQVTEGQWDDVFTEQMVRYLGSQLALPIAGRPDFSREMLDIAGKIGMAGEARDS
jgi:hypothetical protein